MNKSFFKRVLFVLLWMVNGISHEFPIHIGGIYHHLCKDNSITNLVMAIILFYIFKNLNFQSRVINWLAKNIFAVFALNNTLVACVMKLLQENKFVEAGGGGFLLLAGIVLAVLGICLVTGGIRELLFGRLDVKISNMIENIVEKNIHHVKA